MSTDDHINAGISVLVDTDMSLDHLDGILPLSSRGVVYPGDSASSSSRTWCRPRLPLSGSWSR